MLRVVARVAHDECVMPADILPVCHRVRYVVGSLVQPLDVVLPAQSVLYGAYLPVELVATVLRVMPFAFLGYELLGRLEATAVEDPSVIPVERYGLLGRLLPLERRRYAVNLLERWFLAFGKLVGLGYHVLDHCLVASHVHVVL